MSEDKPKNSFWIAFGIILTLVVVGSIINVREYRKRDKLDNEGVRVMVAIDSVITKSNHSRIFINLIVNDTVYHINKRMNSVYTKGDSVPVYYLSEDPSVNGIVTD